MFLNFPNPTRSYHEGGHFIRFFGHDGLTEIAFKIDAKALSDTSHDEIEILAVFDALREKIHSVAREVHSHGKMLFYALTASDFR
jgi:Protein of unknown function (DUF1488)